MLRQQRQLAYKVSRRAAGFCRTRSTEAVRDRSSFRDTPASLTAMPSSMPSQSGFNRTWNASQAITFASSSDGSPRQASHPTPGMSFHGKSPLEDPSLWTETHTQEDTRARDANREDFEKITSTKRSTYQIDNQSISAARSPKSSDDCSSNEYETFCSPLGFHIPASRLREAMLAKPTSTESFWHYTLYQGPRGDKDRVKLHYCKNKEATEREAQHFLDKDVIGFDIEWKSNAHPRDGITKNVALIQIASEERVLLAHIARYPNAATSDKEQRVDDFVAPTLKKIMESPSISKVGVGIKADCTRLRKFLGIDSHGLFELSHLYKLVKFSTGDVKKINKVSVSLAQQVQDYLQLPLGKGDVRVSDWSNNVDLKPEQARYAASDTYAAFQLYHVLDAKRRALNPTPPRPAHAELNLPILLANGHTVAAFNDTVEAIRDASIDAPSNTCISLDDEFQELAIEDAASLYPPLPASPTSSISSSSSSFSSSIPSPPPSKSHPPKNDLAPEISEANVSVAQYINARPASSSKPKPNRAHLRAHHLWQHRSMEAGAIAALLGVDISTVATYVLQAIRIEHFPFEENRARTLVPLAPMVLRGDFAAMIEQRVGKQNAAR